MPAPILQFKRGNAGVAGTVPALRPGEPAFTLNNFDLFVGFNTTVAGNKFFGSHRYWGREDGTTALRLKLVDKTGIGGTIQLKADDNHTGVTTYTFPSTPTDGYFLKTNSSGILSWDQVVSNINIAADTGTPDSVNTGETILFVGGSNLNTVVSNNTITTNLDNDISISGIGTFTTGLVADSVRLGIGGNGVVDTTSGPLYLDSAVGTTIINDSLEVLGDIDVTGNVYIGGTTVTLRGEEVFIENKDIVLGYTTSITPNEDTANHAGVAIASTVGSPLVSFVASGINTLPDTYKQMMWFRTGTLGFATDAFAFNYGVAIGTTSMANGIRLAVGSGITMTDTRISATEVVAGTSLSAPTIKVATLQHSNGTQAATVDTSGNIVASQNLTINGDLYINGSTTQVNTSELTIYDRTITLGIQTGTTPTTTTWDLGVLMNYGDAGVAKTAGVIWEYGNERFVFASNSNNPASSSTSTPNITVSTFAPIEIGALWVNDCAGQSQVISCTGNERLFENITVDAGTY